MCSYWLFEIFWWNCLKKYIFIYYTNFDAFSLGYMPTLPIAKSGPKYNYKVFQIILWFHLNFYNIGYIFIELYN